MTGFFDLFEDKGKKVKQALEVKNAITDGDFTEVNFGLGKTRNKRKVMEEAVAKGDYTEVNLGLNEADFEALAEAIPNAEIIEIQGSNVCPSCGASISAKAKFCSECGAPIARKCASCGTELKPGMKFCPECGAKV